MEKVYVVMVYDLFEGCFPLGVYPTQDMAMASIENSASEYETHITEKTVHPWSTVRDTITVYAEEDKPYWEIVPTDFIH